MHTEGGTWEQSPMGQQSSTKERENMDNAMFQKPDKDCLKGKEDNYYVMLLMGQITWEQREEMTLSFINIDITLHGMEAKPGQMVKEYSIIVAKVHSVLCIYDCHLGTTVSIETNKQ